MSFFASKAKLIQSLISIYIHHFFEFHQYNNNIRIRMLKTVNEKISEKNLIYH